MLNRIYSHAFHSFLTVLLQENYLTGKIPPFRRRTAMRRVFLGYNELTGSIPESLYELLSLEAIDLEFNYLSGTLSTRIGSVPTLRAILLGGIGPNFNGTLPTLLGNLRNLESLVLEGNGLTGTIPSELGNLDRINALDLSYNQLYGTIPSQLGNLVNVEILAVAGNYLTGTVPTELAALEVLREGRLALHNNSFVGSLNDTFCNEELHEVPLFGLSADCGVGGSGGDIGEVEIECSCCTVCCDDQKGECVTKVDELCKAQAFMIETSWNPESVGTQCECLNDGYDLSCADTQCLSCLPSSNGGDDGSSSCIENYDYGVRFQDDGKDNIWVCNMRYVTGPRNEEIAWTVDLELYTCEVAINGVTCNSCTLQIACNDGISGIGVDCSNIEEDAIFDECSDSAQDGDVGDSSNDLLQFLSAEFRFQEECLPCIFWII